MNGVGEEHILQVHYDPKADDWEAAIHHPDSCTRVLAWEKWGDRFLQESGLHPDTLVVDCIVSWELENIGMREAFPDAFTFNKGESLFHAILTPVRVGGWEFPEEMDIDREVWAFSRWEHFVWRLEHVIGWDAR